MRKAQDDDLVMELVESTLARPAEQRDSYLKEACAGDLELLAQVSGYVQCELRMNGFLLEPICRIASAHTFLPGELLSGRFRIIREVAQGGMGVVYEATDEKLTKQIAIKCAKAGFRQQLSPEVRNAIEISHPNVCRTFQIHTASTDRGEVDFITMEFLDGETLAERLKRETPSENDRLVIAQQLCAGLAEAHRNRVIHGDLKSTNIILTKGTDGSIRAVITDFGLAHRPASSDGERETRGGTPDYMAPELLLGEKASVASDVYALGVILHEIACGTRPDGAKTLPKKRFEPKTPSPSARWSGVITRCLQENPAQRFQKVEEISRALTPRNPGKWIAAAVASALLATATGLVTYKNSDFPNESVTLAMFPFAGSPITRLSADISDRLTHLSSDPRVNVSFIPLREVVKDKIESPAKTGAKLGATHVLHGYIQHDGDTITLHAYLTDVRTGVDKEWTPDYSPDELRYIPMALTAFVTSALQLPPIKPEPTVNAAAQANYLTGLADSRQTSRTSKMSQAIALLKQAVEADPDSPLTHAALADVEWMQSRLTQDANLLAQAKESFARAEKRNMDLSQVHRIAGSLKAGAGHSDLAILEYLRAIELNPRDAEAYRRLGQAYDKNTQINEAGAALRQAVKLEPDNMRVHQSLGAFYRHTANFNGAIDSFRNAIKAAPDEPDPYLGLATAYHDIGRFDYAETQLRIAIQRGDSTRIEHELGYTLMHEGRDEDALSHYRQALACEPSALLWLNFGVSLDRASHHAEAHSAFQEGFLLALEALPNDPMKGRARSELAYLEARLRKPQAQSDAEQALQFSPKDEDTLWMVVATYEVLGRRALTHKLLKNVPEDMRPGLLARLKRYPDMASLQLDSDFKKMTVLYDVQ